MANQHGHYVGLTRRIRHFRPSGPYGSTVPPRKPGPAPRDWLIDADSREKWQRTKFGEANKPGSGWKTPADVQEQALVSAAKNQHRLAQQVHDWMRRRGLTTEDVAQRIGMSPDLLRDILNGSAHVYLTDLHRIGAVIGKNFVSTYDDSRRQRR